MTKKGKAKRNLVLECKECDSRCQLSIVEELPDGCVFTKGYIQAKWKPVTGRRVQ
ncbi:MAG TPA: hypothetical protein VGB78_09265 [Thermoplasmata archaeon]